MLLKGSGLKSVKSYKAHAACWRTIYCLICSSFPGEKMGTSEGDLGRPGSSSEDAKEHKCDDGILIVGNLGDGEQLRPKPRWEMHKSCGVADM
jgi:hypothetical protein